MFCGRNSHIFVTGSLATPRRQQDPSPTKSTQAERDGAGASIGTSTPLSPLVRQRESPIYPHVPCECRTLTQTKVTPAEPLSANPLH